jgi:hypothetical protein
VISVPIQPVTRGPRAHFFGYYDKTPWDITGRYLLGMETPFIDRPPAPHDVAVIGFIDSEQDFAWRPLAETHAWNWQMGARLHWLPTAPERQIIHNQREGDRFVAIIRDVFSGQTRVLPRPIYDVTRDGKTAFTLNFSRLADERPGYGYAGLKDPGREQFHPDNDGIWRFDLTTGREELLVSYDRMANRERNATMEGVKHWFNHILANPSGTRLLFYHRWRRWEGKLASWHTRVATVNADGSDLFILPGLENASHYDWFDDERVLVIAQPPSAQGFCHFLIRDRSREWTILGERALTGNGHSSFSPDRQWLLTDTYPDQTDTQTLVLFRLSDGTRFEIGRFLSPPHIRGEVRCDLHPRWSRDGRRVCFDSAHDGNRQMYVADVSQIVCGDPER